MKLILGILFSISLISVAACEEAPKLEQNFKITVTVETPYGIQSGSTVRQIQNSMPDIDWPDRGNPARVSGEAVVVEMGEGKPPIFALISDASAREFYSAFPVPDAGPTTAKGIAYHSNLPVGTSGMVELRQWPQFVTFTDLDDPKTVKSLMSIQSCYLPMPQEARIKCKEVGPHITENTLNQYFGEGVSIKSVTIEITDEPIDWGKIDPYITTAEQIYYSVGSYVFKRRIR